MTRGLFDYPKKAAFDRILPKSKVYAFGKVTRRLQNLFAREVEQIVWRYKLAPETINLPVGPDVPEIQIFSVELKAGIQTLSDGILRCIDNAIAFPIIFEVYAKRTPGDRLQVTAAYKRPSEADSSKWVVGDYFATGWMATDTTRSPLPVALNLAGLYERMLHQLMPMAARPGEPLQALADRYRQLTLTKKELGRLDAQLRKEKQFNRKVELNRQLRQLRSEFESLAG